MVCKCGHKANEHEFNRDWKSRERCMNKNEKHQRCNCRYFTLLQQSERGLQNFTTVRGKN